MFHLVCSTSEELNDSVISSEDPIGEECFSSDLLMDLDLLQEELMTKDILSYNPDNSKKMVKLFMKLVKQREKHRMCPLDYQAFEYLLLMNNNSPTMPPLTEKLAAIYTQTLERGFARVLSKKKVPSDANESSRQCLRRLSTTNKSLHQSVSDACTSFKRRLDTIVLHLQRELFQTLVEAWCETIETSDADEQGSLDVKANAHVKKERVGKHINSNDAVFCAFCDKLLSMSNMEEVPALFFDQALFKAEQFFLYKGTTQILVKDLASLAYRLRHLDWPSALNLQSRAKGVTRDTELNAPYRDCTSEIMAKSSLCLFSYMLMKRVNEQKPGLQNKFIEYSRLLHDYCSGFDRCPLYYTSSTRKELRGVDLDVLNMRHQLCQGIKNAKGDVGNNFIKWLSANIMDLGAKVDDTETPATANTQLELENFGQRYAFLNDLYDQINNSIKANTLSVKREDLLSNEANVENLRTIVCKVFAEHLKKHSTFVWKMRYPPDDDSNNIAPDGLCGYRAMFSLVLRYFRSLAVDANPEELNETYLLHTKEHDRMLNFGGTDGHTLRKLLSAFRGGLSKLDKLYENKRFSNTTQSDYFSARARLVLLISYLERMRRGEHCKFFADLDGWCEVSIAPLLSTTCFDPHSPLIVFAEDVRDHSYMRFQCSNYAMRQSLDSEILAVDYKGSSQKWTYSYLKAVIETSRSNILVHRNAHFFVGNVSTPDVEFKRFDAAVKRLSSRFAHALHARLMEENDISLVLEDILSHLVQTNTRLNPIVPSCMNNRPVSKSAAPTDVDLSVDTDEEDNKSHTRNVDNPPTDTPVDLSADTEEECGHKHDGPFIPRLKLNKRSILVDLSTDSPFTKKTKKAALAKTEAEDEDDYFKSLAI